MRLRPLFTSTALHAGIVCGMGIWIGTSIGVEPRTPAQVRILPGAFEVVDTERDLDPDEQATGERATEPALVETVEEPMDVAEPAVEDPVFEERVFEESVFEERVFEERVVEELAFRESAAATHVSETQWLERVCLQPVIPDLAPVVEPVTGELPAVEIAAPKLVDSEEAAAPAAAWVDAIVSSDHNTPPVYPRLSVQMRECGIVDVRVEIDALGNPTRVTLEKASRHPRLNRAAVQAVQSWRFEPAKAHGVAQPSSQVVGFEFALGRGGSGTSRVRPHREG